MNDNEETKIDATQEDELDNLIKQSPHDATIDNFDENDNHEVTQNTNNATN